LAMPFIESIMPFTIAVDKIICNIKKKAISVERLSLATTDVANKKASARKLQEKEGLRMIQEIGRKCLSFMKKR
jgi:hypothetical protein